MRRILILWAIVTIAAGAAGQAAASAPIRFRVSIVATRTTLWSESKQAQTCGAIATVTGHGSETLTLRTEKPLVLGAVALRDPLHSGTRLTAVAERTGSVTQSFAPNGSWCQGYEGACQPLSAVNGQYWPPSFVDCASSLAVETSGCGKRAFTVPVGDGFYLGYGSDAGDPHALDAISLQFYVSQPVFKNCPGPRGAAPRGMTSDVPLPLSTLLSRRSTVLTGSSDDFAAEFGPTLQGTTHAAWTVRFERIG
jgi:hypothetical protein